MALLQPSAENCVSETVLTPHCSHPASATSPASALGNSSALDQWRGLALVLVLISHGLFYTGRVHGIGRVGVNLFFFISGILVFRSLAKERGGTPWQQAGRFWKRRLRRLYPAMISFLVAMAPIVYLGQHRPGLRPHSDFSSFLSYLGPCSIYLTNYVEAPISIGHLWSVSCEMQFYLLAPVIFFLGGGGTRRRNLVWGAVLLALLVTGAAQPKFGDEVKYQFIFAVWPMMLGFFSEYHKTWLERMTRPWAKALIGLGLVLLAASLVLILFGSGMKKLVIISGAFVMLPCFIYYVSGRSIPGVTGRGLGWIGERTYSIYMWQQPLSIAGYLPQVWHWLGATVSIGVGGVWFYFFERPFLSSSRRQWIAKPAGPGQ